MSDWQDQRVHVWSDPSQIPVDWPASVVTIGVFDGVHRGHRELIRQAVDEGARSGLPVIVMTFDPNPVEVVRPGEPPARIATLQQRLAILETLGIDGVVIVPFTEEIAQWSPERFAADLLRDQAHAATVVVGTNFRFGHKAHGDVELLEELGQELGFVVKPIHLLLTTDSDDAVSSTMIRELINQGDVSAASRALVRPHRIEGTVVRGDGRGKGLGFPTANLDPAPHSAIPADGVYAGRLVLAPYTEEQRSLAAAISVGTNPTFDGEERRVEAFAFDSDDIDLYDQAVAIDFVAKIRDQKKFTSEQQLIDAVDEDVASARSLLGS